jgi:choline transport protein
LYELLVACAYYGIIAACIAEVCFRSFLLIYRFLCILLSNLPFAQGSNIPTYSALPQLASAIPSAGGIYHWASVTPGPKYGRILGFFAGSLNFFGWIFDLASIVEIVSNVSVQMYAVYHPDLVIQPWHIYIAFLIITWAGCAVVIFFNRAIPYLQDVGLFLVIGGGLITIIAVAAMPQQHASKSFVWTDWENVTGWSNGVAFLTGVLNGAFTIGTPDAVTHMAEELPNPKRDMPRAIAAQIILGTISEFAPIIPCVQFILRSQCLLQHHSSSP